MADTCTGGIDTGFVDLGAAKVAFLGVIQGLTELLPISTTAHMRIVPALLGWQDRGSAFSAAIATRRPRRRRLLFLDRRARPRRRLAGGGRPARLRRLGFSIRRVDRVGDDPHRPRRGGTLIPA